MAGPGDARDSPGTALTLLRHISLLVAVFSGAMLATGARLKWDPSAYVPLRELAPYEYSVAACALPAAGFALLGAAHVPLLRPRRCLLRAYAALTVALMAGEVTLLVWLARRAHAWAHSEEAVHLAEALAPIREHLHALLLALGEFHPLPEHVIALLDEAEADAPRNGYVAAAAVATLLLLQATAAVLALAAARAAPADFAPFGYSLAPAGPAPPRPSLQPALHRRSPGLVTSGAL